jgi:hypothetical protein
VRVRGVRALIRAEFFKSVSGERVVAEQASEERSSLRIRRWSSAVEGEEGEDRVATRRDVDGGGQGER